MARNPNVTKMRIQRFRKRRGAFLPNSDPSTLDNKFADPKLQKFWAERVTPKSMSVNRVSVPQEAQGFFEYRKHAKSIGKVSWLDTLFPGVHMQSPERKAAIEHRLRLMHDVEMEPTSHIVISRTKHVKLCLFYNLKKTCWYWCEVHYEAIRRSISYSSKERAVCVMQLQQVRWLKPQPETLGSLLNSS
jgi:hypothetical protein